MMRPPENKVFSSTLITERLVQIKDIYDRMDRAYAAAAAHYGFHCEGCRENCCQTRFHHHTVIEYLYLMEGVRQLTEVQQEAAVQKAKQVVRETRMAEDAHQPVRIMCPLNENELCLVYPWRPMICRLHGLPHELCGPGGVAKGVGCLRFDAQTQGKPYYRFDRTPIYKEMALLERDIRQATGVSKKIKMTIAEMLTADDIFNECP
jgi:Fe-S-cluster containining protein